VGNAGPFLTDHAFGMKDPAAASEAIRIQLRRENFRFISGKCLRIIQNTKNGPENNISDPG